MTTLELEKIIAILKEALTLEDVEIKDCILESLIDMLQDQINKERVEADKQ